VACLFTLCRRAAEAAPSDNSKNNAAGSWNPKAAAAYLDYREGWWMAWPTAARDHDTFCISCHTAVPYALSRPALRAALGEQGPSANERSLLASVTKRVRLWKEVEPFYSDEKRGAYKTSESRGTEAVLNALVLASHDAQSGPNGPNGPSGKLSADARTALDNMWALQQTTGDAKGAWPWLRFHNEPWEADDSQFYGAALAAIAVGTAPENYLAAPEIQNNLALLRDYLNRECDRETLINRVVLLWAAAKVPGLLAPAQQKSIMDEALSRQQPDGGWSLGLLVGTWKRADGTPLEVKSDGYATGLIVLALEQSGLPRGNVHLQQGLAWLAGNQSPAEGRWLGYSLNKQHDLSTETGHFMSDAATAYAVLALTKAGTGD